jgi:hypothetical protein
VPLGPADHRGRPHGADRKAGSDDDAFGDDRPTEELDDEKDRDELRRRYYGLLQELRVLLPGVQILVAFLLTAPFASGFAQLDELGRDLYGIALASGVLAVIVLVAPTVFHRVGPRQSRVARLQWGVRLVRVGLVFFAVSLLSGVVLIWRYVFGDTPAIPVAVLGVATMATIWVLLPRGLQHETAVPRQDVTIDQG